MNAERGDVEHVASLLPGRRPGYLIAGGTSLAHQILVSGEWLPRGGNAVVDTEMILPSLGERSNNA